jgi:hypothetical protein
LCGYFFRTLPTAENIIRIHSREIAASLPFFTLCKSFSSLLGVYCQCFASRYGRYTLVPELGKFIVSLWNVCDRGRVNSFLVIPFIQSYIPNSESYIISQTVFQIILFYFFFFNALFRILITLTLFNLWWIWVLFLKLLFNFGEFFNFFFFFFFFYHFIYLKQLFCSSSLGFSIFYVRISWK